MDHIGSMLISLCKSHRAYLATKLAALKLFPGQDGLLYHLSINDGQTMSEMVEKLSIQHATLFTMVERMSKANLIRKDKHETDKRASRIYLTPEGKKVIKQLSTVWKETEAQIAKQLSVVEKQQFIALAKKINSNLNGY